ncbi:hypothetical protein Tco_1242179 [Tanacetum coccineum]
MESVKKSINERALHKREYDIKVNERQMQTKEENVDTSKALNARQHHAEQPEFNNEGEVDQNAKQSVKFGQHGQFLKEKSNEAKDKKDIDDFETINVELEHSMAKLLAENEHLHKENEHLKQTYNDLYDSIKKTRDSNTKSKPNGNLIYNSIMHGPHVRRMILELGDPDREVPVVETFHEQTDEELTEKEVKQMEANDQAIQIIFMGSDIGIQDKKAKLFNEWERFTSTDGESIESYYHHFLKLMNDFKRNKHFLEKIASNLKFLSNLQPEWRRHVIIVHQTKDLHEVDYTQLYDFLKYNQAEINELRAEQLTRAHDPLELMENSNNPYNYLVFHQDQPSSVTYMQQLQPNNNFNLQSSFNTNYMQQPMPNPKDITDPTTAMNMELVLMAKAFKLNYSTPTNNNQRISSNPHNRQIAQPGMNLGQDKQMHMVRVQNLGIQNVGNQNGLIVVPGIANQNLNPNGNGNVVAARAEGKANRNNGNQIRCYNCRGLGHLARNLTVRPKKRDVAYLQTQLLIAQKEEVGIKLQAKDFYLMAAAGDLDEIKEVNTNCILMANLQQASTSSTQTDKAPVYDSDGSAEGHEYDNCYNNDILNMFTQEEQYTELLDPIPEPHQVQRNDSDVIFTVSSMEQNV